MGSRVTQRSSCNPEHLIHLNPIPAGLPYLAATMTPCGRLVDEVEGWATRERFEFVTCMDCIARMPPLDRQLETVEAWLDA